MRVNMNRSWPTRNLVHVEVVPQHSFLERIGGAFLRRGNRHRTAGRSRHALPPLLEGRVGGRYIAILLEAIIRPEVCIYRVSNRLEQQFQVNSNSLLATFGEVAGDWGTLLVFGRRISRILAPQLILLANGLVGLADVDPSVSSIAHSSAAEADDEFDDTDPRLNEKLVCNCGGEFPLTADTLIRRR